METKSRNLTILVIVAIIAVGITAWKFGYEHALYKSVQVYKGELKTRLAGTGMFMPEGTEVKQLSGTIKSIDNKTLTVELSYPKDSFSDPSLDERIVTVEDNTTITLVTFKDSPIPPQIFDKESGNFSSLNIGQMINITTAENVRDKKRFTAKTIEAWESQTVQLLDL